MDLLTIQIIVFLIFVLFVLDSLITSAAKRVFPKWSQGVCSVVIGFLLFIVLISTVPGRTRHVDYMKQQITDEVTEERFNDEDSTFRNWLGRKLVGWSADLALQKMRVKKYFGMISVGFMKTDDGWHPVSIGMAGIVCRNFFFDSELRKSHPEE